MAVIARPAVARRGRDAYKARQVFVLGAESVIDPRAHRGTDERGRTAVQKESRRPVRHALGLHRVDEAQVVHMLRHLGKQFRHPAPALAVPRKRPRRFEHALRRAARAGVRDVPRVVEAHHLAIVFRERGLVVERIDMAWTALHEDKDDPLGARLEVRRLGRKRIHVRSDGALRRHARQREVAEATGHRLERVAAGEQVGIHHDFKRVGST